MVFLLLLGFRTSESCAVGRFLMGGSKGCNFFDFFTGLWLWRVLVLDLSTESFMSFLWSLVSLVILKKLVTPLRIFLKIFFSSALLVSLIVSMRACGATFDISFG